MHQETMRGQAAVSESGWVELARLAICVLLAAVLMFISVRTFSRVQDANDTISGGSALQVAAASGDKTLAYVEGGFEALIAVGAAVGLYVGTRAFD